MDIRNKFLQKWNSTFPNCEPPKSVRLALQNPTQSRLKEVLNDTRKNIKATQFILQQLEFMENFISGSLTNNFDADLTEEDPLDQPVPSADVQYDTVNSPGEYANLSDKLYDNQSSQNEPAGEIKSSKPKPMPRPRLVPSNSKVGQDRTSMFIPLSENDSIRQANRGGSLDSYYKKDDKPAASSQPPPQIPKKPPSIRQILEKEHLEEVRASIVPSAYEEINFTNSNNGSLTTFRPQSSSHSPLSSSSTDTTPSPNLSHLEPIYDEPIQAKLDAEDNGNSSSDDEPQYLNLRHYKKSLQQLSVYGSLDISKLRQDKLDRAARTFSFRYSLQAPTAPLPKFGSSSEPQVAKSSPLVPLIGVTEEVSSTDDDPNQDDDRCNSSGSQGSIEGASMDSLGSELDDPTVRWKKRSALQQPDTISNYSEDLDLGVGAVSGEFDKGQMRHWLVKSILDSEQTYTITLDVLQQYMKTFRAVLFTKNKDNVIIPEEDISAIFFNIPELHEIHNDFIRLLRPRIDKWTPDIQVADLFKELIVKEIPLAKDYIRNYQKAIATVHRCMHIQKFSDLAEGIKVIGIPEVLTLEELLHKPVVRIQRNTLVLHDLINCTPVSHTDYDILQKTLKISQDFLDHFETPKDNQTADQQRYLAKYGPIVQKVTANDRKLRYIFLFNDIIVCCKQKLITDRRIRHEARWYIPLLDLTLEDKLEKQEDEFMAENHFLQIEEKQRQVADLQGELKKEMKKQRGNGSGSSRTGGFPSFRSNNRNIERIKKKLVQQETELILNSPYLVFRLKNGKTKKEYTLLMSSDYERNTWKETITGLKGKVASSVQLSSNDLESLINTVKLPKLGNLMDDDDSWLFEEEQLFGALAVTIHKLQGSTQPLEAYCCLELDSFGHFFLKAKTNLSKKSQEPTWNENFEVELEGSQTLRILVYHIVNKAETLLCRAPLELSKAWLRGEFLEKNISLTEKMSIVLSLRYITKDQTISRAVSSSKGGVFGVPLATIIRQECTNIPLIVKVCVEEIEKRGLKEEGIYRVSGLSQTVQDLKKNFNKNSRLAAKGIHEVDVNVVSSLLKLYFRELPEALFTDILYHSLEAGVTMTDPEAKEKLMLSLIESLPQPNYSTAIFMLDHLLKVAGQSEFNKMTPSNLSTVFGPTLLRPAVRQSTNTATTIELFKENAKEAMVQAAILNYLLQLRHRTISTNL